MSRARRRLAAAALSLAASGLTLAAADAAAQTAELQLGALGGYGIQEPYRGGVGGSLGLLTFRLIYIGGSFTHYFGATVDEGQPGSGADVRTNILTADIGINAPIGPFEVLFSSSIGSARFSIKPEGADERSPDRELVFAPGVTLLLPVSRRIYLAGDVSYYFVGTPEVVEIKTNSLAVGARFVVAFPLNVYPIAF